MKNFRILVIMTFHEARRFKMYPTEAMAVVLSRIFEMLLLITFWLIIAKYATNSTVDPKQIISYYLIINGITTFFFTQLGIGSLIIRTIKSGYLNHILTLPISPLIVPWSQRAGRNGLGLIIGGIQVVAGVILAGGLSSAMLPYAPIILFNTIVLNLAFNFIVGTFAFYLGEASGIKNTTVHIYNLCGGVLIPLFLMPVSVANLLQFTPFPAAQYHMAIMLQGSYVVEPKYIFIGFIWAIIAMSFALWFWRVSLHKYEAIGI